MTLDREALLARIMSTQSVSRHTKVMSQLIVELATEMGAAAHIDAAGNVYATKGLATHYPCLVAHTDTVHDIIPVGNFSIHRSPDGLLFAWDSLHARQTGIGGDDKVGIYIALSIMDELPACKCAFFRDEEIGCLGAGLANLEFFEDCAFAIEADRRGYGDVIRHAGSTELHGDEFANALKPYLKEYGYANAFGMMTDVQRLKEKGLTIAAANFSCGYYEPHTRYEYIDKAQMEQTRAMLLAICQELATQTWAHVSPKASHQTYGYGLDTRGGTHTKFAWLEHDTWCDLCDEESLGLVYCSTYDGPISSTTGVSRRGTTRIPPWQGATSSPARQHTSARDERGCGYTPTPLSPSGRACMSGPVSSPGHPAIPSVSAARRSSSSRKPFPWDPVSMVRPTATWPSRSAGSKPARS
jgi:tripeptide aminopeptidase